MGSTIRGDAMSAWTALGPSDYATICDWIEERFFPPTQVPSPWVTYQIPFPWTADEIEDAHARALAAFRACTPPGQRLSAVNWHHEALSFDPHTDPETWESTPWMARTLPPTEPQARSDRWHVPVLPNGDYYIFLAPDRSWGWVGFPWDRTEPGFPSDLTDPSVTLFGEALIRAVEANKPMLFRTVLRRGWRGWPHPAKPTR